MRFDVSEGRKREFRQFMVEYHSTNGREFLWRTTTNDFHALIAEVMLQKTSATQVLPVYESFSERYPTPQSMLDASERDLQEIFGTLGLKKRWKFTRNIAKFFESGKDVTQENLLDINGVGRYTANAFLSIHKGEKLPIVDANVARAFREFFDIDDDRPPYANKTLWSLAEKLLPDENIREYQLGLLDYGASLG